MRPRLPLICVLLATACHTPPDPVASVPKPAPVAARTKKPAKVSSPALRAVLDDLSLLTTGTEAPGTTLDRWASDVTSGARTTDDIIDDLLRDKRFLQRITKLFVWDRDLYLGIARFDRLSGWVLKNTGGDHPIYYAREACEASVAVDVHPWWDMKHTVKVCPDSYRPDVLWMSAERACSSLFAQPGMDKSNKCGCGPNLMRCSPDQKTFLEFRRQFLAEIEDTVADVVDRDQPLKNVYLTNETVRKPLVELQYDVWRAERGEIKELPDVLASWPAAGQRAPRFEDEPGDHAGIATAVGAQFNFTGLRAWMRSMQQSMWCVSFDNSHVEAKTLLDAARGGNANLRGGAGWQKLAAHPVCGRCHARMDYGWQFFVGYADIRIATHFVPPRGKFAGGLNMVEPTTATNLPDARDTMGKLYVNDINDYRGERPREPVEYMKWAVDQPEFGACQSRRIVEHVFGRDATSEDRLAITSVFEKTQRFRPAMREALRRYVARRLEASTGRPAAEAAPTFLASLPSSTATAPDTSIKIMPETRALLERHCLDCHGSNSEDPNKNFELPELSRDRMMLMLGYVADGRMPKTTEGIEPADRRQFLIALISNLWATEADRRAAFDYYDRELLSTSIELPDAALDLIYEHAGAKPATPVSPMIETTLPAKELQYTPGFAAHMSVEALRACKAAHAKNLEACVEKSLDLEHVIRAN